MRYEGDEDCSNGVDDDMDGAIDCDDVDCFMLYSCPFLLQSISKYEKV